MLLLRASSGSGILSTSLVRMDTLDDNTAFGRLAAQQIASRVAQHGFLVLDIRLTDAMIVNKNGEFMLSRDLGRILSRDYNAFAVLVGTYAYASDKIYVSARVLRLVDGAVIGAYEYYLPLDADTAFLLGSQGSEGASPDSVWRGYAARGQAFSGSAAQPPSVTQPPLTGAMQQPPQAVPATDGQAAAPQSKPATGASVAPQGSAITPLGRESVAPSVSRSGSHLPERIDDLGGGRRIDPGAKPSPIGTGARQR
jgi:hypothetical protein